MNTKVRRRCLRSRKRYWKVVRESEREVYRNADRCPAWTKSVYRRCIDIVLLVPATLPGVRVVMISALEEFLVHVQWEVENGFYWKARLCLAGTFLKMAWSLCSLGWQFLKTGNGSWPAQK